MTAAWRNAVEIHLGARRAWPHLPRSAPPASIWIALDGTAVRVQPDGTVQPVRDFGHRSIASDPTATRRAA